MKNESNEEKCMTFSEGPLLLQESDSEIREEQCTILLVSCTKSQSMPATSMCEERNSCTVNN
jgi:hypothetical protein